ncbi:TIGR00730 family Rossman fold protein [Salinisphaera sp.]|uniref:LOG family protein n=1 Tax=Salinisphaera sp. TaxID=1914330 RepID=UPI002D77C2BB|nr:TIGR00730 family Rossman fold protein [Salinisphaera sp.]HET7313397.1 TIGR00730 family Rossman fold protein [Salinisphaera sp.]
MDAAQPKTHCWLCVYCGSRDGGDPRYREAAGALGAELARTGIGLVYGGARVGLMGALADAALAAGGPVLGVIPRGLAAREVAHDGLTELRVVETMHQRKLAMIEAADGFIAMPGGFGTLEELFEVLTWHQIGWHDKPAGLFDVAGFYQPLIACMAHMRDRGFVGAEHVARIAVSDDARALIEQVVAGLPGAA